MTAQTVDFAAARLARARARLLLERPFLGSLVMYLPLQRAGGAWCKTVATDAAVIYYNAAYIASRTLAELQFLLAHEALHCALGHGHRRSHRLRRPWDVACDHAVNLLLIEEGMAAPPGCLANPAYRGLSAEEIYPLISKVTEEEPIDLHAFDLAGRGPSGGSHLDSREVALATEVQDIPSSLGAGGEPKPAFNSLEGGRRIIPSRDTSQSASLWRNRLIAAAQAARSRGALGRIWQRLIDDAVAPQIPWTAVLASRVMALAKTDYSFQRPSRREGEACLPALTRTEPRILVALDSSGSIGAEEMQVFACEIDALKGQIRAHVTLLACDNRLAPDGPWDFPPENPFLLPHDIGGGGGTRFTPVFEWLERAEEPFSLIIYFTDAMGEFPQLPPLISVLWLVKGNAPVPWGERLQLN